jgi:hypothetical protein
MREQYITLDFNRSNKYDYGLILLISILIVGEYGGPFQPIRIISLLFLPSVLLNFQIIFRHKNILIILSLWYIYMLLSALWSTAQNIDVIKEFIYYIINFNLFFLMIIWYTKANNGKKSILIGWYLFFVLSIPIALNEYINDIHLSNSIGESNMMVHMGNEIYHRRFASITFGNSNAYAVILVYILLFLCTGVLYFQKSKQQFLLWILIMICMAFMIMNASRGGIITSLVIFVFFIIYNVKYKNMNTKTLLIYLLICLLLIYFYRIEIYSHLFFKFINGIFQDDYRIQLIYVTLKILKDTYGFGIGVGVENSVNVLRMNGMEILAVHNIFLEILLKYGIFILSLFLLLVLNIIYNITKYKSISSSFLVFSCFITIPFWGTVNSGYLLAPIFWIFLASLYTYTNLKI